MALAYTAPTWEDGSGTGISASQLQAMCNCIEGLVQGTDKAVHAISMTGAVITLTFADGTQETVQTSGLKGIASIAKTGSSGLIDTYTITYTDGTTSTFTVTNGQDGTVPITKYNETLTAGTTSVTFTDVVTTASSIVQVATDDPDLEYNSITNSGTSYTVTFDAQASNVTVYLLVTEVA